MYTDSTSARPDLLPVEYHDCHTAFIVLLAVLAVCHVATCTVLGTCGIALLVWACGRMRKRTSPRELRQQLLHQSCSYEEAVVDIGVREDGAQIAAGAYMQPCLAI